jgi:hypothetical protein
MEDHPIPGRRELPHFRVDVLTTTGGLVTILLTIDEAASVIDDVRETSDALRKYMGPVLPASAELKADRAGLRTALIIAYCDYLSRSRSVIGHDEGGASWGIRTEEIVAIRVADPDLEPQPLTPLQVGFAAAQYRDEKK